MSRLGRKTYVYCDVARRVVEKKDAAPRTGGGLVVHAYKDRAHMSRTLPAKGYECPETAYRWDKYTTDEKGFERPYFEGNRDIREFQAMNPGRKFD